MKRICLFDPALEDNRGTISSNLGDLIIQEAVLNELRELFHLDDIFSISTHHKLGLKESVRALFSDFSFIGGSNLLSSRMDEYHQWRISLLDIPKLRNVILMGVGWWQYQEKPNMYTAFLLRQVLSNNYVHSVRDQYTLEMLKRIGIHNVYNTGCPTMWRFSNYLPVPCKKAENVLTTLTDYNKDQEFDLCLLKNLQLHYNKVYFWPQGRCDKEYVQSLGFPVHMLEHNLESYYSFLKSGIDFDYVGTRLHGGIYCLANGKRSLIIAIDNRAREISSDSNIPVVERGNIDAILGWILHPTPTQIILPRRKIDQWKAQFS